MQYGTLRARILLGRELHSTLPSAAKARGQDPSSASSAPPTQALFVTKRINRIESCGTRSRIKSRRQTDKNCKDNPSHNQPPRNRRQFDRIQRLPLQISIRAEGNRSAEGPAEQHSQDPTEQSQNANLMPPLENRHHQGVHNSKCGHGKCQASKNPKQKVKDREKCPQRFRSIQQ